MKHKKKPYYQRKVFKMKTGGPAFNRKTAPKNVGLTTPQNEVGGFFKAIMAMAHRGGNR